MPPMPPAGQSAKGDITVRARIFRCFAASSLQAPALLLPMVICRKRPGVHTEVSITHYSLFFPEKIINYGAREAYRDVNILEL